MEQEILYENRAPLAPFSGTRAMHTCHAVRKPIMNAFAMVSKMGGHRLPVAGPEFGAQTRAFATTDADRNIAVLVYNFDEDLLDPEKECAGAEAVVKLNGIGANAECTECYCLSRNHSNAHTQWIAMGKPKDLEQSQINDLKSRGRLETIAPPEITKEGDGLSARLSMPGNSAKMFVMKKG
jgi:hypothetical protein